MPGGVLPFRWLFIAVDTATAPPSQRDIVGRSQIPFRTAARRWSYVFVLVSAAITQHTYDRNLVSLQL